MAGAAADVAALPDLAPVGAGGIVQYFTNGFDTRTKGVDLVATHAFQIANGRLSTQLAYNYNSSSVPTYDVTVICGGQPGPKNSICLPGHTPAAIVNIQHYAPNHRARFRTGEIRVLDSCGNIERTLAFDESDRRL